MPLRTLNATRYVTPLREGGSLPAIVEADDLGLYVLKFRGAGQGTNALIAELVAGEIARAAGLAVPELALMELDPDLARSEPDPEIQALIRASAGLNLALDYLPGSTTFDAVADPPAAELASAIVWLDAFVSNVDRTARNPNILSWHRRPWLIDHGASLYFHHGWRPDRRLESAADPFVEVRDHILMPWASELRASAEHLRATVTSELVDRITQQIPTSWLAADGDVTEVAHAGDYADWLNARIRSLHVFLEEAERVRALRV